MSWFHRSKSSEPEVDEQDDDSLESEANDPITERMLDLQRTIGNLAVQRMVDEPTAKTTENQSSSSGGEALDAQTLSFMEEKFGEDLGDVMIHTNAEAATSAHEKGAKAYTTGRDIYFTAGRYAPHTEEGKHLLAHEVAHVLQQTGETKQGERAFTTNTEHSAERAANTVTSGGAIDFALPRTPTGVPALAPGTWTEDVKAAFALTDETKKTAALAALVQQALGSSRKVNTAGKSSNTKVQPADYQEVPIINFDINLNKKQSWPPKPGEPTRLLSANYGYSFNDGPKNYAILGVKAIDEASPIFTQMSADHEIYHTQHHLGGQAKGVSNEDQELETYTQDFLNYFHQLRSFGPQWKPLIDMYEGATASAQATALGLLVGYYNKPPSPPIDAADVAAVQKAFMAWLKRRLKDMAAKKLIVDLDAKLNPTPPTPTP